MVALALILALAGCGSDAVSAKVPADAANPLCASVSSHLPATLLGGKTRKTDPASTALHAWGDPAIIWRCGVPVPGPTTEHCIGVNGVDWVVDELSDGVGFTTYGRSPAIQVLVPKHYAPETFALTGLSTAVQAIPQGQHRCS